MDPSALDLAALSEPLFAAALGLSLAATCGLRAFLPLLSISLLAWLGRVDLGEGFLWMASPWASLCFGTAVVAETLGDKFPVVDHALDTAGVLVKPAAGALATASMITGMDPMLAVVVGLITGGAVAEGVHMVKAKTRVLSSAFTGTLANPFLSIFEDVAATLGVILAWVAPVLALLVAALGGTWILRRLRRGREGVVSSAS